MQISVWCGAMLPNGGDGYHTCMSIFRTKLLMECCQHEKTSIGMNIVEELNVGAKDSEDMSNEDKGFNSTSKVGSLTSTKFN